MELNQVHPNVNKPYLKSYYKLGYLKDSNAAAHSVDTGIS